MRIGHRGEEYKHVADILDQDHPTLEAAAKAAIKGVAEICDFRTFYTLIISKTYLHGLFTSEGEAEKFGRTYYGGDYRVVPIQSAARTKANVELAFDKEGWCKTCRCPQYEHLLDERGHRNGKCTQCDCKKFRK